jgi:hypothetical protein
MSVEPLKSAEPELAALFDSERRAEPPPDALGRVWSRIAVIPPIGLGGSAGSALRHGWLASHAASMVAVAFVAGGATGAAVYATVEKPPAPQVVYVEHPVSPAPVASSQAPVPERSTPVTPPAPAVPLPAPQPAPSASTSLFAERALIDGARGELASGNASHALVLLEDHVRRFPKPQLGEEREALVIQSLVTLGRYDEARSRATHFRTASPDSLFLPAIEASLGSIP